MANKFREFTRCPKCDTFLGYPESRRMNTKVIYRRVIDRLLCRCKNCGYEWHEFTKEDTNE